MNPEKNPIRENLERFPEDMDGGSWQDELLEDEASERQEVLVTESAGSYFHA